MTPVLKKTSLYLLLLTVAVFAGLSFSLAAAYLYLSPDLPSVASIRDVRLQTPLKIYSTDGKLIGEFGEKRRDPINIEDTPEHLINALLSAEDADFYSHNGVSIRGLARAVKELILTGQRGSGGSTLTMQLTRNVFFSLEKKFSRKFNEIILAMKLERELTKDEILELYINYMYLGNRAYGVQAASQVYYGKDLRELNVAQMAMIAGFFQLPSTKNAIVNPEWAKDRRDWILGRMLKLQHLTETEYAEATAEPVTASYHGSRIELNAPYIAELAREKAIRSFGLKAYTAGYAVFTTVDSRLQQAAQNAIIDGLHDYDARHGYRGPEQNFPPSELNVRASDIAETSATTETSNTSKYENWISQLKDVPDYGALQAAIVSSVEEKTATLLLRDGTEAELLWENGLSSARPYISENARGPSPGSASETLSAGDLIRVIQKEDGLWHLSQLPAAQAALISLNPNDGSIIAMVGGYNFYENNFNRATQAYRQPGSGLKPFIYAAAIEKGMTAATLINDSPIVLTDNNYEGTWRPKNDGGKFYGPMRLRRALYLSRNLVSVRILQQLGISDAISALGRFGFEESSLARDLSLSLGNASVTPEKMAEAWSIFANGGYRVGAHLIDRVVDSDGNIIYESFPNTVCQHCDDATHTETLPPNVADPDFDESIFSFPIDLKRALGFLGVEDYPRAPKVLDDQVSFIMDSILKDVIKRGTGRAARSLNRSDIAGKTGTTNGPTDAWFSGYNPEVVTVTWVGFDQNTPLGNSEYGGSAALPIWISYMEEALRGKKTRFKQQPKGIVTVKIDSDTGQRANFGDPDGIFEYFRSEFAPEPPENTNANSYETTEEAISEDIF